MQAGSSVRWNAWVILRMKGVAVGVVL